MSILRSRSRARRALATAVVLLIALATASCGSRPTVTPTPVAAGGQATTPAGLERFYNQEISWYPCEEKSGMQEADAAAGPGTYSCARVTVPLSYDEPDGATIELALKRRTADGTSIGSLFIDPGGPGGSGVNLVEGVRGYFSDDLLKSYDVVGFDPRGVSSSTAVECLTDAELDAERSGEGEKQITNKTPADEARADVAERATELEGKCETATTTQGLLDHVDTISAARDLDILRAVVGDGALSYLGYSYGTFLGATYAELFPGNVGRLVLDGAIDPTLTAGQVALGQAQGFENALRSYVEDCQSGQGCPLTGDVDSGVKQVQDFLDRVRTLPLRTSDSRRPLTYPLAQDAILRVMYQSESWSVLTQGLAQAMNQDDGSTLLRISDRLSSRNDDGTYKGNGSEAINAINCLDYPVTGDTASWDAEAGEIKAASPTFGEALVYSDLFCQSWGHESSRSRDPIHASGAAPILVVGTTGDPATPYPWSQALASQLDDGHLLTWDGNGHTAYGRAGDCITRAVDAYLLAGQLPEEGKTCAGSKSK
ncbi:alpha/beta hydrolase [Actinomyces israelii]